MHSTSDAPRFASATAFSRCISSSASSHSIVCTRPFFDRAAASRWDVRCANSGSISSSSTSCAGSDAASRCRSRNAERSTSGSRVSSPAQRPPQNQPRPTGKKGRRRTVRAELGLLLCVPVRVRDERALGVSLTRRLGLFRVVDRVDLVLEAETGCELGGAAVRTAPSARAEVFTETAS